MAKVRQRTPNVLLRRIREEERRESREEFARAVVSAGEQGLACDARHVARWEDGDVATPRPAYQRALATLTGRPFEQLGFAGRREAVAMPSPDVVTETGALLALLQASSPPEETERTPGPTVASDDEEIVIPCMTSPSGEVTWVSLSRRTLLVGGLGAVVVAGSGLPDLHDVESLRQGLNDVLSEGAMAEASLEDWERAVVSYGQATRDRPAGALLAELTADLAELKRTLQRHRSASALRRLTRVTAQMSGLMCLTLCKLDDRPAFRRWARTARLAAGEAGDSATHSWVLAQEAYGHYYSADLPQAIEVASQAQELVRTTPCVGAALAAALEARAHAVMGHHQETYAALSRAENILSHLDGEALRPSAFGYNEASLRFHEGNAYTHLSESRAAFNAQDRRAAFRAQDRALELCAPGDYTDWAMTRLDRAHCLTGARDVVEGLAYATETLTNLTEPQRQGIITVRGHEVLNVLPKAHQSLPAAREFNDLLMLTTEVEGSL